MTVERKKINKALEELLQENNLTMKDFKGVILAEEFTLEELNDLEYMQDKINILKENQ